MCSIYNLLVELSQLIDQPDYDQIRLLQLLKKLSSIELDHYEEHLLFQWRNGRELTGSALMLIDHPEIERVKRALSSWLSEIKTPNRIIRSLRQFRPILDEVITAILNYDISQSSEVDQLIHIREKIDQLQKNMIGIRTVDSYYERNHLIQMYRVMFRLVNYLQVMSKLFSCYPEIENGNLIYSSVTDQPDRIMLASFERLSDEERDKITELARNDCVTYLDRSREILNTLFNSIAEVRRIREIERIVETERIREVERIKIDPTIHPIEDDILDYSEFNW